MKKHCLIFLFYCLIACVLNAQTDLINNESATSIADKERKLSKQDIINTVLQQVQLTEAEIDLSLFVHENLSHSSNLSVMVVPKQIENINGSSRADFYILVIENNSGKIKHKYCELDSVWTSKLGVLPYVTFPKFKIDTIPYLLDSEIYAYGIHANYSILSTARPYDLSHFSLFIPKGDSLIPVLKNYPIYECKGEWD